MTVRQSEATWEGTLREGSGKMRLGSGLYEGPFTWASRFSDGEGTNPEELIGAAHAGCFSMFLSALLTKSGYTPTRIHTTAQVHLVDGPTISQIDLTTTAVVPLIDEETFLEHAVQAKENCPVSKALASIEITLDANLGD